MMKIRLLGLLPALLVAGLLAGGCLEDAADTCYNFANENDANQDSSCGGTTTSEGHIVIVSVSPVDEQVLIFNLGSLDETLTGWVLVNDSSNLENDIYTFQTFSLAEGGYVRIHSIDGTDDADDLYWGGGDHWNATDTALIKDAAGVTIDSCSNGESCWAGGS